MQYSVGEFVFGVVGQAMRCGARIGVPGSEKHSDRSQQIVTLLVSQQTSPMFFVERREGVRQRPVTEHGQVALRPFDGAGQGG